ncbi:MAG: DUF1905 domain-containing protein [Flavobacteriales bacterium]|nr:DUF1905 domain-containing protein [Flavobacteriales bacterium]
MLNVNQGISYHFRADAWRTDGKGGWHFVSLPNTMSDEIRSGLKWQEEGWGRLKARAQIGQSQWDTAIWFDTKRKTYILPLKANIRKLEGVENGSTIDVTIWV